MKNFKKVGTLSLASVLATGIFATSVSADTPIYQFDEADKVKIQVLEKDATIVKTDVVERLKELFPGEFDHLNDSDFNMRQVLYPEDDIQRYELDFSREVNGEYTYGSASFVGEDLKLENFHHEPIGVEGAAFPPTVTKDEAEEIAKDFLNKFSKDGTYQLSEDGIEYWGSQTLLEPIRYGFSFDRTNEDVVVTNQTAQIVVLGNGQVIQFYQNYPTGKSYTYDDQDDIQDEKTIQEKVQKHLSVGLEYQIDYDFATGEQEAKLVYSQSNDVKGIHAISGHWQTEEGFIERAPEERKVYPITESALEPRTSEISVEQARAFAEELLAVDSDDVKLVFHSIDERESFNGRTVISIDYMYEYPHGGMGTNLEIDKETGEIVHYHDMGYQLMQDMGDEAVEGDTISKDEALEKAINYLKEYAPSILHHYAMPTQDATFEEYMNAYQFKFPRTVNGIPVNGDHISVGIAKDGSLQLLNVNYNDDIEWPSADNVISKEDATQAFKDALTLDLRYVQADQEEEDHYAIVYLPVFNGNDYSSIDANTGEWTTIQQQPDQQDKPTVSHPTAEEELNFLLSVGILKIDDVKAFDPDAEITRGKAIETIMRSLRPYYDHSYPGMETQKQSFDNIGPDHPLYQYIESALSMGILETDSNTFDVDAPLTKEELAVWYIRGIGLEKAAAISDIYQADFTDTDQVSDGHIGYVALADALDLVTAENNAFNPEQEISYADMAVSIFKFAELYE